MSDAPRNFADTLPPWPAVDFTAFGEVDVKPLPRMRKIAAGFLARNWAMIPHVTHHDDADVTALEESRKQANAADPQAKLTVLPYLARAAAIVLGEFPQFNASLDTTSTQRRLQEVLPRRHRGGHAERLARARRARL